VIVVVMQVVEIRRTSGDWRALVEASSINDVSARSTNV